MSCDKDLSGTDLKIVEYSIVTVDPNTSDSRRIIQPTKTVATTDDMDENGFIAWVIAKYFQDPDHKPISHDEKQYLRVCYCVQCRFTIPDVNYQKQQSNRLRDINETLKEMNHLKGGQSQDSQGGQGQVQGGQGGSSNPLWPGGGHSHGGSNS